MNTDRIARRAWRIYNRNGGGMTTLDAAQGNWYKAEHELAHRTRKLGLVPRPSDPRDFRLSRYMTSAMTAPPPSVNWGANVVEWGELLNDSLGCCTIAAVGHAIQTWTAAWGKEADVTDAEVLQKYEHWCGYNPADPSSDQGGDINAVVNSWRKHNFAGHTILADAAINVANQTEVMQAIDCFGGCDIGMAVPNYIMAAEPPETWDVEPSADNGIDGYHSVFVYGYDADGVMFASWGEPYRMTWAYWMQRVYIAKAIISRDFLPAGKTPIGFDMAQLTADLAAV